MTTYQQFGGDVPISQLPAPFAKAVEASIACATLQKSADEARALQEKRGGHKPKPKPKPKGCDLAKYYAAGYDTVVGSAQQGYGYCADPKYRQMTYCACANAPIANAECVFGPCQIETAYNNTVAQAGLSDLSKNCPKSVNCQQVFIMGGSDNVASDVSQTMRCGGVVNNIVTNVQSNPVLAVVALILILSVVLLASSGWAGRPRAGARVPPALAPPRARARRPAAASS